MGNKQADLPDTGIGRIVGARLTSVSFTMDYLILGFDEKGALTILVWPDLKHSTGTVRFGAQDYRNQLCALIEQRVVQLKLTTKKAFWIELEGGTTLRIPLRTKLTGERAILTGPHHYLRTW